MRRSHGVRHAGRVGDAEGGDAGAGLHQKAIGVAVVAAFELDDEIAAGGGAGDADGAHGGLRADETKRIFSMAG